jgi:hypothetical protein
MSHTAKGWTAIIVVIVVIIVAGTWYSVSHSPSSYTAPAESPAAQSGTTYQITTDTSAGASSQSDTSNAALQSDLSSTDSQMSSFNSDAAASAQ